MSFDVDRVQATMATLWDTAGTTVVVIVAAVVLVLLVAGVVRQWRRGDFSAKASLGFSAVQAGVTYAVVLGVYEFFAHVLHLPVVEATVLAVFIEAATWAAIGFIAAHAKRGGLGFGPAGPFFWVAVLAGGTLAVLGAASTEVAIGRVVIVAIGAYMWYLRLLQIINRREQTSYAWTWTPARLLQAIGAVQPRTDDAATEHDAAREYQIRRIARAIRWVNSRGPWSWLGMRTLARRAETVDEDVITEARRRWALAHVLRNQSRADSPTMAALIAEVQRAAIAAGRTPTAAAAPANGQALTGHPLPDTGHDRRPDSAPDMSGARLILPPDTGHRTSTRNRTTTGADSRPDRSGHAAGQSTTDLVAMALAEDPRPTQAQVADRLGISERTVRRHWRPPDTATGQVNGSR